MHPLLTQYLYWIRQMTHSWDNLILWVSICFLSSGVPRILTFLASTDVTLRKWILKTFVFVFKTQTFFSQRWKMKNNDIALQHMLLCAMCQICWIFNSLKPLSSSVQFSLIVQSSRIHTFTCWFSDRTFYGYAQ